MLLINDRFSPTQCTETVKTGDTVCHVYDSAGACRPTTSRLTNYNTQLFIAVQYYLYIMNYFVRDVKNMKFVAFCINNTDY